MPRVWGVECCCEGSREGAGAPSVLASDVRGHVVVVDHCARVHGWPCIGWPDRYQVAGPDLAILPGPAVGLSPPPGRIRCGLGVSGWCDLVQIPREPMLPVFGRACKPEGCCCCCRHRDFLRCCCGVRGQAKFSGHTSVTALIARCANQPGRAVVRPAWVSWHQFQASRYALVGRWPQRLALSWLLLCARARYRRRVSNSIGPCCGAVLFTVREIGCGWSGRESTCKCWALTAGPGSRTKGPRSRRPGPGLWRVGAASGSAFPPLAEATGSEAVGFVDSVRIRTSAVPGQLLIRGQCFPGCCCCCFHSFGPITG